MTDAVDPRVMANAIRALAMDGVEQAKSGHPGMPMGMADVATVLFSRYLKYDPSDPSLARPRPLRALRRPRLDAALLAALSHRLPGDDARRAEAFPPAAFEDAGASGKLHDTTGVETTTGPLGQGVATSVGMALAERMLAAEFGEDIVDHRTFVLCSDGDLMEGVSHEAIALAGPSEAEQADLPLRRQRHLDRRAR